MADFWVYENHVHNKAVVHRGECSFCDHGRGLHGTGDTPAGHWLGAFSTAGDALAAARRTGKANVWSCKTCAPG